MNIRPKILMLLLLTFCLIAVGLPPKLIQAQANSSSTESSNQVVSSPKPGWGEFKVVEEDTSLEWWEEGLLWPVNRFLDLLDAVKVDVGAGGSLGGVVRITKYGNVGYRSVSPASLRVGAMGRDWPVMLETSNEFGIGPGYVSSKDRDVCTTEVGVGLDLFIAGYVGVCIEEVFDFALGIFFLDPMDDDIR